MSKKTPTTCDPKTGRFQKKKYRVVKRLAGGILVDVERGSDKEAKIIEHYGPAAPAPFVGEDPEEAPEDEVSKHRYPPPSTNKIFRAKWAACIDNISSRPNFKPGHLDLLEILCHLYVDLDGLTKFLRKNGMTYKVNATIGQYTKPYPEVEQKNKVLAQIKSYSQQLDLFPKKDKSPRGGHAKDAEEWG